MVTDGFCLLGLNSEKLDACKIQENPVVISLQLC